MSGSYGFSINLELKPTDTTNLIERVNEYLEDLDTNESELLREVLIEDEGDMIVFFGDHENHWRHDYSPEVLSLLSKIENDFGGKFKGDFFWYEYEMEEDTIQEWVFDGEGEIRYDVRTESNEEDFDEDEEE